MSDILVSIDMLEDKKQEIDKQIELLKQVNEGNYSSTTYETFKELCLTPLRYKNEMLDIIQAIFPEAINLTRDANTIKFELYEIGVEIPLARYNRINIDNSSLSYLMRNKDKEYEEVTVIREMRKHIEIYDDRNKNHIIKRAKMYGHTNKGYIMNCINVMRHESVIEKTYNDWIKRLKKEDEYKRKWEKEKEENIRKYNYIKKNFCNAVEVLKVWTNNIYCLSQIDEVYGSYHVDKFKVD